jgi:glutamate 5-kinase
MTQSEYASRSALRTARRVCIKAGTSVVANETGRPSLTRLGAITEQITELKSRGVQVILVSSGAVGMGKRLLSKQRKLHMSFTEMLEEKNIASPTFTGPSSFEEPSALLTQTITEPPLTTSKSPSKMPSRVSSGFLNVLENNDIPHTLEEKKKHYDSACAAAGQFEMMNLYSALFAQCDIAASQVLVTQADFADPARLETLKYTVERLLKLGIVPIINENDAVAGNMGFSSNYYFSDNDSLAAICARNFEAEVLLLLTDVKGVYDQPPSNPGAKMLEVYTDDTPDVKIGDKSAQGTYFKSRGFE